MRFFSLLVVMFVLIACKKDKVSSTKVRLLVVNASPNTNGLSLQQNLKPLGTFNYINGITPSASFVTVDSGFQNYKLFNGTAEITSWVYANDGLNYSFFMYDSAVAGRIKYFFVKDNLDTAGLGTRAYIRLIHLSPDIDSVELVTNKKSNPAEDSLLLTNPVAYYGTYSQSVLSGSGAFTPVSGDTTLTVKIKRRQNNSVAKTYQIRFSKQKIYSLVLKGYQARGGKDSLSLSIVPHN